MEQIEIDGTGIMSSRIALGTWAIGGWMWGGTDTQQSIATIHAALDRGITMIDTAPAYGFGRSEEIVGEALAQGGRRDRVLIATKFGLNWHDGQVFRDASPERIRQEVEDSLRRLRTDYIDLYQVHWPDPTVPIEDNRPRTRPAVPRRQDQRDRRQQLFARARWSGSARWRRCTQCSRRTTFRADDRNRRAALRAAPRADCAGLWRAVPWPADRPDARGHTVHRRRPAPGRSEVPAAALPRNISRR